MPSSSRFLAFAALCLCGALTAPASAQAVGSHLFDVPINVNGALQVIDVKVGDSVQDLADAFCDNNALPRQNAAAISAAIVEKLQAYQAARAAREAQIAQEAQAQAEAQAEAQAKAQAQAEAQIAQEAQAQAEAQAKAQAQAEAQIAQEAQAQAEAQVKAQALRFRLGQPQPEAANQKAAAQQTAAAAAAQRPVMFSVPVDAGERGATSIPIYEGDVPKEVAAAFLARNNLPAELQGALVDGIMAQFRDYQARQASAAPPAPSAEELAMRSGEDKVLQWLIDNYNGQEVANLYREQNA